MDTHGGEGVGVCAGHRWLGWVGGCSRVQLTCIHVRVAAQGALGGAWGPLAPPRVVPLVVLRRDALQGVIVQSPRLGAQHRG